MSESSDKILRFIKRIRRRLRKNLLIHTILLGGAVGFAIGTIINTMALLIPIYGSHYIGIISSILGMVVGGAAGFFLTPDVKKAALIADITGLKERLTTAYENFSKNDRFSQLQREDTLHHIDHYNIKEQLPLKMKKRYYAGFIIAVCLFIGSGMIPSDTKKTALANHMVKQEAKEEIKKIEETEKEIEKLSDTNQEELLDIKKELSQAKKELEEAKSKEDIEKAKERLEKKIEQAMEKDLKKDAVKSLTNLAAKLERKDYQGLQESLEQLKDNKVLSEEELKELNEALTDAAKEAAQKEQDENQSNGSNQAGQDNQGGDNDGSGSAKPGSQGNPGSQNGSQPGQGDSNGNGAGDGSGTGSGSGSGSGSGNGSGQGTGSGSGGGWNYGSKDGTEGDGDSIGNGNMVWVPSDEGSDENLTGKDNQTGTSHKTKSKQVMEWRGNPVNYNKVITEYTNQANTKINNSSYPAGVQDIIKQYFKELNE